MFTGIIQAVGQIVDISDIDGDKRLDINVAGLDLSEVEKGGSIAVSGVCLTAIAFTDQGFQADVSVETLQHTTLGQLQPGSEVNLEKSLTPSSSLGGHWVSGHVDGVAEIIAIREEARSQRFDVRLPESLARYVAKKGSICIDGASLTVNSVQNDVFDVNIIPHTMQQTIFSHYRVGTCVNIEVDVIARYLERLSSYAESCGVE